MAVVIARFFKHCMVVAAGAGPEPATTTIQTKQLDGADWAVKRPEERSNVPNQVSGSPAVR